MELPYAETMNFWKTSRSGPDTWLDRANDEIEKHGGEERRDNLPRLT